MTGARGAFGAVSAAIFTTETRSHGGFTEDFLSQSKTLKTPWPSGYFLSRSIIVCVEYAQSLPSSVHISASAVAYPARARRA